MVRLDIILSTTLLLGAAGISAASFDQETAFYQRSLDSTQDLDAYLQARHEAASFSAAMMRRNGKAKAPAPKKEAPKKEAPKTVNKTTVKSTNINKSTTNNANMSGK